MPGETRRLGTTDRNGDVELVWIRRQQLQLDLWQTMELTLAGQAVLGPGLPDWTTARAVLSGAAPYVPAAVPEPAPELLPANERRRTSSSEIGRAHV